MQNHIFSSYPFQLIVIPKNINVELKTTKYNLLYGEKVSLCVDINYNLQNYVDLKVISILYSWEVFYKNEWKTLINNTDKINEIILEPGNYKFKVNINISIDKENNISNPIDLNLTTNTIDIIVQKKLTISEPIYKLEDKKLYTNFDITYNKQVIDNLNFINYAWYLFNVDNQEWELQISEKVLSINLTKSNKYIFRCSTNDNLETIWSKIITIFEPYNSTDGCIKFTINLSQNYEYKLIDSKFNIIRNGNILKNEFIPQYQHKKNEILYLWIKDDNDNQYWQLINIEIEINNDNNENQPNVKPPIEELPEIIDSKKIFYKQTWFLIFIIICGFGLILLIIWIFIYLKRKKN